MMSFRVHASRPRARRLFLALLPFVGAAGIAACGSGNEPDAGDPTDPLHPTPPVTWAEDPEGEWLRGDLHVHATGASNDTGGNSQPEDIAAKAQELGLFFVVLTDHSNSTGSDPYTLDEDPELFNQGPEFVYWDLAAELSVEDEFIMVSGNEISPVDVNENDPRGHVGCIPRTLSDDFDVDSPFIDRPRGVVSSKDVIDQALDRGCFTILNHPYAVTAWITSDWTSFDYEGMEVWNGGANSLDSFDMIGWDAFRCDLLQGRKVTPIAASDNHRVHHEGDILNPPLGRPTTSVFSAARTWDAIIEGLDAGLVAMGEGDSVVLLDTYDEAGARAEGADARYVRVRGELDERARRIGATLRLTLATSCVDSRPATYPAVPKVTDTVLLELEVAPGETFDISTELDGTSGVITATLLTGTPGPLGGVYYSAMSRAVVIP